MLMKSLIHMRGNLGGDPKGLVMVLDRPSLLKLGFGPH